MTSGQCGMLTTDMGWLQEEERNDSAFDTDNQIAVAWQRYSNTYHDLDSPEPIEARFAKTTGN